MKSRSPLKCTITENGPPIRPTLAIKQHNSHSVTPVWWRFNVRLSRCSAMMIVRFLVRYISVRYHLRWSIILPGHNLTFQTHCFQLNDQHAMGNELIDDFKTLERPQKDLILVWVLGPTKQRSSSAESGDFKENGSSMTFMIVLAVGKLNGDVATFRHTCEGCPREAFADLRVVATTFPFL